MTKKISDQEIVNKVYKVFVTKNTPPSKDSEDNCVYVNTYNGVGCAIGIFIKDQVLAKKLDRLVDTYQNGIADAYFVFKDELNEIFGSNINLLLLVDLQTWHDNLTVFSDRLESFRQIVITHNLKMPQ